eukprot:jgi/Chrpa1/21668/Chrysochromulina_OHIO_Genome00024584-RA
MASTALILAAQRGDSSEVKRLLAADASEDLPNVGDARHNMTAIAWAAASDEESTVAVLLADPRTDASVRSSHRMTPLHHAAAAGSLRTLVQLVDATSDADVTNEWLETPLHLAAAAGHRQAIKTLLAAGADTAPRDRWGRTAAMVAYQQGHDPEALGLQKLPEADEAAAKVAVSRPVGLETGGLGALVNELSRVVLERGGASSAPPNVIERHIFESSSTTVNATAPPPPPPPPPRPPPPPPRPPPPPAPACSTDGAVTVGRNDDLLAALRIRAAKAEECSATAEQAVAELSAASAVAAVPASTRPTLPRKPALSKLVEYPGDAAAIAALLAAGSVEPSGRDLYGLSALHKFVAWDKRDLCEMLLPHLGAGDSSAAGGPDQQTVLHAAADMGGCRALQLLLERHAEGKLWLDLEAKDKHGRTAHALALERGHEEPTR